MPSHTRLSPWSWLLLGMLAALALVRGAGFVLHRPLLALANNYDQIRYSVCLDLAPWRPGEPADRANPQAPLSRYAFQPLPADVCVWTSDLLFTAPVALAWRLSEHLGSRTVHSVQRLGEWRLLLWLLVAAAATAAFVRAGRPDIAAAHLLWLALVGMDPANLVYFPTFYAEAAALFGFYLCTIAGAVALLRPTLLALAGAALGAAILAGSKFQHLLLPLLLGAALWLGGGRATRHVALAVGLGGLLGFALQVGNVVRDTPTMQGIATTNRANFVLSVLLPETGDRERVERVLGLEAECAAYAGANVYAMPLPVGQICTRAAHWSALQPWWLLLSDPPALARALARVPALLLPWIPPLGLVEGGEHAPLPPGQPSLSGLFGADRSIALALLLLPWLLFAGCRVRRAAPAARAFALMCASGSSGVALVALFGDGDVEFAKHAQLSLDYALASLGLPLVAVLRRFALLETRP
jgi:hypothetical protein